VTTRKPEQARVDEKKTDLQDSNGWESVFDGIERMQSEGGVGPDLPHQLERVQYNLDSTNSKDV
jgi:hypothetical protein